MIKIVDTLPKINDLFDGGEFNYPRWRKYINSIYRGCEDIFIDDVREYISTGNYTWAKDFLPKINEVYSNDKLQVLHSSFLQVIDGLNEKIVQKFGREVDVDIVLYLGLCNAAGWVTDIDGKTVIFLGIEKIIELDWCSPDDMYGLIYHELGHVYQAQYGVLTWECKDDAKNFVWQLFTEGVAMYFEQALIGDINYYHQDKNGWCVWCDQHFEDILRDFRSDLPGMSAKNQRYFGDWADYNGRGDVGYYLGARFVHFLLDRYAFDDIISLDIDKVYGLFQEFCIK